MALKVQPWRRMLLCRRLLRSCLILAPSARLVSPAPPILSPHSSHLHTPHTVATRSDYATEPHKVVCWSCHRDLTSDPVGSGEEGGSWPGVQFFCPCERRVVLPPTPTSNYFNIMNCPISYQVDTERLKGTYKQLQRELHPDKFSRKSEEERDYSAQQSAMVNRAYSTLLKPYSRGLYMLKLRGLSMEEAESDLLDSSFLERMWLLREALEYGIASGDTPKLLVIEESNTDDLAQTIAQVSSSFESGDYTSAKKGLAQLKYYMNIKDALTENLKLPP